MHYARCIVLRCVSRVKVSQSYTFPTGHDENRSETPSKGERKMCWASHHINVSLHSSNDVPVGKCCWQNFIKLSSHLIGGRHGFCLGAKSNDAMSFTLRSLASSQFASCTPHTYGTGFQTKFDLYRCESLQAKQTLFPWRHRSHIPCELKDSYCAVRCPLSLERLAGSIDQILEMKCCELWTPSLWEHADGLLN